MDLDCHDQLYDDLKHIDQLIDSAFSDFMKTDEKKFENWGEMAKSFFTLKSAIKTPQILILRQRIGKKQEVNNA